MPYQPQRQQQIYYRGLFFKLTDTVGRNSSFCTNGSPAMVSVRGGFVTLVKNKWPQMTSSHCSVHRYALASKTLPPRSLEVMDITVSDQLHSCEGQKSSALQTPGKRNGSGTCGTSAPHQSPLGIEGEMLAVRTSFVFVTEW